MEVNINNLIKHVMRKLHAYFETNHMYDDDRANNYDILRCKIRSDGNYKSLDKWLDNEDNSLFMSGVKDSYSIGISVKKSRRDPEKVAEFHVTCHSRSNQTVNILCIYEESKGWTVVRGYSSGSHQMTDEEIHMIPILGIILDTDVDRFRK